MRAINKKCLSRFFINEEKGHILNARPLKIATKPPEE
jgi:hypothetical protein